MLRVGTGSARLPRHPWTSSSPSRASRRTPHVCVVTKRADGGAEVVRGVEKPHLLGPIKGRWSTVTTRVTRVTVSVEAWRH